MFYVSQTKGKRSTQKGKDLKHFTFLSPSEDKFLGKERIQEQKAVIRLQRSKEMMGVTRSKKDRHG